MGQPSYGNYESAIPRPKTMNSSTDPMQNAVDEWNNQGDQTRADQSWAGGQRNAANAGATAAMTSFNTPQASAMAAYQQTGVPPSAMAKYMAALPGYNPSAGGQAPSAPSSFIRSGAGGGGVGGELAKFDSSAVTNFDPSSYGKQFAEGAYGDMKLKLGDELNTLQNKSVGAGRLRTGWLGKDQGQTVSRNAQQFEDAIARASVDFSGQRLNALTSGNQMMLQRAQGMDTNALDASKFQGTQANAAAERAQRATESANNFAMEGYKANLGAAGQQDALGYQYWDKSNTLGFEQASNLDANALSSRKYGLDAALDREKTYLNNYNTTADRGASYASATRNWANADRERADLQAQIKRTNDAADRAALQRQLDALDAKNASQGANQKIATSLGVPYKG